MTRKKGYKEALIPIKWDARLRIHKPVKTLLKEAILFADKRKLYL